MPNGVCMLGLPGSGKTSYLAALYEVVSHDDLHGAPRLAALPEDRHYLQGIHERWLRCEPAVRTRDVEVTPTVRFELSFGGEEAQPVAIPDVAGEAVRALWEERRWRNGLDEIVSTADDVMLFLRADAVVEPLRVQRILDPASAPPPLVDLDDDDEPDVAARPFNPEQSPTQVKLVDLLQAVIALNNSRPLALAIVLSAWDRFESSGVAPLDVLRIRLPLLWQYLIANPELLDFRAFGVSAQGGDFEDPSEARRLLHVEPPSGRMLVTDGDDTSHDVSRPLQWLWTRNRR